MLSNAQKTARARSLVAALNLHDAAACAELFAPNAVHVQPNGTQAEGRQAIETYYQQMFAAFPDVKVQPLKLVAPEGQTVIAEYTIGGTHLGPLTVENKQLAPTGRTFEAQYAVTCTLNEAGQITRFENTGNPAVQLRSLGILPSPFVKPEQAVAQVQKLVDLLNQGENRAAAACFTEQAVFGSQVLGQVQGRQAIEAMFAQNKTAFPDLRVSVVSQAVEDNTVVSQFRLTGTQTGPFAGRQQGTGKKFDVSATLVSEVGPQGITAQRLYQDEVSLLRQVGLLA